MTCRPSLSTSWRGAGASGRLRVIATVQAPDAMHAILAHLARSVGRAPESGRPLQ
jgi:hypothetical protein